MYRHVVLFPTGLPGIGLLLLRISMAVGIWPVPPYLIESLGDIQSFIALGILFVCLSVGMLASVAALLCFSVIIATAFMTHGHPMQPPIVSALVCLSAAIMGPGAYSFDAMVYGHRLLGESARRLPKD